MQAEIAIFSQLFEKLTDRLAINKKPYLSLEKQGFSGVGVEGFEPPTPCSQSMG